MAGDWEKFLLKTEEILKRRGSGAYQIRYGKTYYWVPRNNAACACPSIKVGEHYLLMGREIVTDPQRSGLIFNKHSLIMPWDKEMPEKLQRFAHREMHGFCPTRRKLQKTNQDII